MGLLSSTLSLTRYAVQGTLSGGVLDTLDRGLRQHAAVDIDDEPLERSVGWTDLATPYAPTFDRAAVSIGDYLVFALRIDQKSLSAQVVKKRLEQEISRRRAEEPSRPAMSRSEKKHIREAIVQTLYRQIPATPHVYDLVWHYEQGSLWFFSTLKRANEELEALFAKSFHLTLVRLFPYTLAELSSELTETQRDALQRISPTDFGVGG